MLALRRRRENQPAKPSLSAKPRRVIPPTPSQSIDNFIRGYGQDTFNEYKALELKVINRCGTTGCHGSPRYEGDFRLFRRDVLDQRLTARNLEAFQKCIDLGDPNKSPVLYESLQAHGGLSLPPLGGVNDPLYRELRDWVFTVAGKYRADESLLAGQGSSRDATSVGFGAARAADESNSPATSSAPITKFTRPQPPTMSPGDDVDHGRPGFGSAADDSPPPEAPQAKPDGATPTGSKSASDPFDPNVFNRQSAPVTPAKNAEKRPLPKRSPPPGSPNGVLPSPAPPSTIFKPAQKMLDFLRQRVRNRNK